MSGFAPELARVERALADAMELARRHAAAGVDVEWKHGGSPVTAAAWVGWSTAWRFTTVGLCW